MNIDEAPTGALVAVGHPANGRVARKGTDGRLHYLDGLGPVSQDDQRALVGLWPFPSRVGSQDFRPGDLAEHRSGDLDPREVVAVGRDWLILDILSTETERLPKDNYTVYDEAEGAL